MLLSVPHAGRDYDAAILANAAQGRRSLETLEDPLVDRLCWRAIAAGFGAVIQNVPRAVIDCNRDEEEVDPAAIDGVSARTGRPAGTIRPWPCSFANSSAWHTVAAEDQPSGARAAASMKSTVPIIGSLANELDALAGRFGEAVLIDCHSMPSRAGQAEIVIGDRHGTSAAAWLSAEAARIARAAGFKIALNDPYAGGAIISRHGRPAAGIHAIQLEIDRATYLSRDGRTPGVGFDRIAGFLEHCPSDWAKPLSDCAEPEEAAE